jgi:phage-related protein (TIGR01555 family)
MSNRRNPRQEKKAFAASTSDSFQNFTAHVGRGTGNQQDGSMYGFNPVTRNRMQMEMVYRGSWIAGRVVDAVAQDMTREGMDITSTDDPSKIAEYTKEIDRLHIWKSLRDAIKWARLYGGGVAFMMIDGQNPSTPLKLDRIRPGQFKGLMPVDRWVLTPSLDDLVDDMGVHFGKPRFYDTITDSGGLPRMHIHYSRVIRIEGVELPYWQKISENLWGQSVLERMWDRLIAYDSATSGISQMVYKAHLRTLSVEGLREIIGGTTGAMKGLLANLNMIRVMQTNEGITLLDTRDKFETHQYAFGGLDVILAQFGEQLAGAVEIPLVRLFGQSPAGFSTGESDIRAYYDSIKQQQVSMLGDGVETVYRLAYISKFGTEPPKEFSLDFKALWQMSATEKSQVTNTTVAAIGEAFSAQIISKEIALKELKALSQITGAFTNIQDEDIERAEELPDPTPEALGLIIPKPAPGALPGQPGKPGLPGKPKPKLLAPPKGKKPAPRPPRGKEVGGVKGPKTSAPKKGKDAEFFERFDLSTLDKERKAVTVGGQPHHGFDPQEKRDPKGQWTLGNGGKKAVVAVVPAPAGAPGATKTYISKNPIEGRWTTAGKVFTRSGETHHPESKNKKGEIVPAHITYGENEVWHGGTNEEHARLKALKVPPAWTQIRLNPDPTAGKQVTGRDEKNRSQSRELPGHREAQNVLKFDRLADFNAVRNATAAKARADMENQALPLVTRHAAAVVYIISQTGFRPGSEKETNADVKAYGTTQLEGRHAKVSGHTTAFTFVGKKGVDQEHEVVDPRIAKFIRERGAKGDQPIFAASYANVDEYFKGIAGDDFKIKDMRTWVGTQTALAQIAKMPVPKDEKAHKQAVKAVAEIVSDKLGNKPAEALKSYIDPIVWKDWAATMPKKSKVGDWLSRLLFADAGPTPEGMMTDFLETHGYLGERPDWRDEPGDDDEGDEEEDFDAVYAELFEPLIP